MTRRPGFVASLAAASCLVASPAGVALGRAAPLTGAGAAAVHAAVHVPEPEPAPVRATDSMPAPVATPVVPVPGHDAAPAAPARAPASAVADAILVVDALIAAGTAPAVAIDQVAALTPEDLAVLAGHPAMLQVAGDNAALTRNLVIGLIVLGGIIALAAASDGGGAIVTN